MNWKRNLILVWVSQFFSLAGFSFALPFAAYFMQQDLGITDPKACRLWMGLFSAAAPISLAIVSPLWGVLADRHGRKPMMLRANLGGAVVLSAMGFAPNVQVLIVMRLIQGLLTGTVTAAQALVASYTPEASIGVALGSLSAAVFAGSCVGVMLGSQFASAFGYRYAFVASGGLLLLAALFAALVTERFERPSETGTPAGGESGSPLPGAVLAPVYSMIFLVAFVRFFDAPVLPFLVQEIRGRLEGAEVWNGRVMAAYSAGAMLSGFLLGRAADRWRPATIAQVCAVLGALTLVPQAAAHTFWELLGGRFLMAFFAGGLDPVLQIWLSRATPAGKRASSFGWAVTVRSTGWGLGALASGIVARELGVRPAFWITAGLCLAMVPVIRYVARREPPDAANGRA